MIRAPISVCSCTNRHSSSVSGPRLLQDRVGDGDLADVVQLGGVADLLDLVLRELEEAGDVDRELGDVGEVVDEARVALDERAQQDVLALPAGRALPPVLLRVHPLIRDPKRLDGVVASVGIVAIP